MKNKYTYKIKQEDIIIPVNLYKEMRLDERIGLLKNKAIIRVPLFYTNAQVNKAYLRAEKWIIKHLENNPKTKERFRVKKYKSGDELKINNHIFILDLQYTKNNNYSGFIENNKIIIKIPYEAIDDHLSNQKAIKTIQSRLIAQFFHKVITARILELNKKHFGIHINSIKLKYNHTNWGSRSAKNNINISTRLLFAPNDVQDYVFIHELAHFKEMNHSSKFWKIVEDIMPDYNEKEKWLKENSAICDF